MPTGFLNSNYRLMGVFSSLGCCSCGWFRVIRLRDTHWLALPITRYQQQREEEEESEERKGDERIAGKKERKKRRLRGQEAIERKGIKERK